MKFLKTGDGLISSEWIVRIVEKDSDDNARVQYFDGEQKSFTLAEAAAVKQFIDG